MRNSYDLPLSFGERVKIGILIKNDYHSLFKIAPAIAYNQRESLIIGDR